VFSLEPRLLDERGDDHQDHVTRSGIAEGDCSEEANRAQINLR